MPFDLRTVFKWLPAAFIFMLIIQGCTKEPARIEQPIQAPDNWLFTQRAFPNTQINHNAVRSGVKQYQQRLQLRTGNQEPWQSVGPENIGGRITTIAYDTDNAETLYAGTSVGGLYKTEDGGFIWTPVFEEPGAMSIGAVTTAPSQPATVYVGTGEANGSSSSGAFFGNGIYRSDNGGETWTHKGLEESNHIGRIIVDPDDPARVFVAAGGVLYGKNEERGLYRSKDGGESWDRVLFVSDSTACIDLVMHPTDHDTIYCVMWERIRFAHVRRYAGPTSSVHRSYDGGDTWTEIATESETGLQDRGRMGIAISKSDPSILYLSVTTDPIINEFAGLFRSSDYGTTWERQDQGDIGYVYASFGWFFGNVRVHPEDPNTVYLLGLDNNVSDDAGRTWDRLNPFEVHVDQHAYAFHPTDPTRSVAGNDGGIYFYNANSDEWRHVRNISNNMFYACTIDPHDPDRFYGGVQDNGTLTGLADAPGKWEKLLGGDGFRVQVDPVEPERIYAETQWGGLRRSENGGDSWLYIPPPLEPDDRTNWNTPFMLDPHDGNVLYYGSSKLHKSVNRGDLWSVLSPDLTNPDPDVAGGPTAGTISTIAISWADAEHILVGTDDGLVQRTRDGGDHWIDISEDLPVRYVTKVAFDPFNASGIFATFSGYRDLDYLAHVWYSPDFGETWTDISGNLPEVPVNDIVADPDIHSTYYVATDLGTWSTSNAGASWEPLGTEMPATIVVDLDIDAGTRTLLAATYGRSMFTLPLEEVSAVDPGSGTAVQSAVVFPNPAIDYFEIEVPSDSGGVLSVRLFDIDGRLLAERNDPKQMHIEGLVRIERNSLPPGAYLVHVVTRTQTFTAKVIFI